MPCSHHLRIVRRPSVANSVAHPKGRKGKLHLPPDGQVKGDQNQKCVHEGSSFINRRSRRIRSNSGSSTKHKLSNFSTKPSLITKKIRNCTNFDYLRMPKLSPTLFYFLLLPLLQLKRHPELDLG